MTTLPDPGSAADYPRELRSGPWPTSHVQGVAVDRARGHVYYSFTTLLVKTDLAGTILGTLEGMTGHLGDITFNDDDGRLYSSLEYKAAPAFYIAIVDVAKIDRVGMQAQDSELMSTVLLREVVDDFTADVDGDGVFDGDTADTADHRYGCSGIDGTTFGPAFGRTDGPRFLTVAYGVYSHTGRTDNDHQVLLQYDISGWRDLERPLTEAAPHRSGPDRPDGKYFVFTGNTTFGVQNLEYDAGLQRWFLAVYPGKKDQYPNYQLFAIDATAQPTLAPLRGLDGEAGLLLPLAEDGLSDPETGLRGWNQNATVGFESLGDGLFFISTSTRAGGHGSILRLHRWTGEVDQPFAAV